MRGLRAECAAGKCVVRSRRQKAKFAQQKLCILSVEDRAVLCMPQPIDDQAARRMQTTLAHHACTPCLHTKLAHHACTPRHVPSYAPAPAPESPWHAIGAPVRASPVASLQAPDQLPSVVGQGPYPPHSLPTAPNASAKALPLPLHGCFQRLQTCPVGAAQCEKRAMKGRPHSPPRHAGRRTPPAHRLTCWAVHWQGQTWPPPQMSCPPCPGCPCRAQWCGSERKVKERMR